MAPGSFLEAQRVSDDFLALTCAGAEAKNGPVDRAADAAEAPNTPVETEVDHRVDMTESAVLNQLSATPTLEADDDAAAASEMESFVRCMYKAAEVKIVWPRNVAAVTINPGGRNHIKLKTHARSHASTCA